MKKISAFIILFFILINFASATSENVAGNTKKANAAVSISGTVEDEMSNEKLVCARIEIEELKMTFFTDILGNFSIDEIKPGNYTFKVSYISYEDLEIKEIDINSEKEINIQLKPL